MVLPKRVPYEVVDSAEAIAYMRRLMCLDDSSVLVNAWASTELGAQQIMDKIPSTKPVETRRQMLVSFSVKISDTGMTSVLDVVRPVIDAAAKLQGVTVNISIQLYDGEQCDIN